MSDQPQDGAALLARIKPVRNKKSTYLCLRPDLIDEYHAADEALVSAIAEDASGNRLASGNRKRTVELAERVQELEAQIEETQVKFTAQAMNKDEFRALCDQYPPRQGNQIDMIVGYDRDAVGDAMVRPCVIDPVFDDASWAQLVSTLNPSEWTELRRLVDEVNDSVVESPKSELASRILSRHAAASAPQPASE